MNFKKNFLLLLLPILLSTVFNTDPPKNSFKHNGKEHLLQNGFVTYLGEPENEIFETAIVLAGDGLVFSAEIQDLLGAGEAIFLMINSTSRTTILDGIYIFDKEYDEPPFSFGGSITIHQNSKYVELDIISGKVTISSAGNKKILKLDVTVEDNKKVTGYFKGNLKKIVVE